ncbi:MAG: cytochrome c, partial [Flavobacteriaceae bacterium]|nr:cytochrome c [Flavobacteriaceae bacterium]
IYCAVCHGAKGDGQGVLVKNEVYLGVPNYKDRAITIGSVYHVMQYGINSMGSYAAQTDENERWQIAHYVMKLNAELRGEQAPEIVENVEDWQADFAKGYEESQAPITEE